jgi:hypothetical protein
VNRRKLLARLAHGALQNVAFRDIEDLARAFGFRPRGRPEVIASSRIPALQKF